MDLNDGLNVVADNFDKVIGKDGNPFGQLVNFIPGEEKDNEKEEEDRLFYLHFLI